jgi:hypothetical protein
MIFLVNTPSAMDALEGGTRQVLISRYPHFWDEQHTQKSRKQIAHSQDFEL